MMRLFTFGVLHPIIVYLVLWGHDLCREFDFGNS